MTHKKERQQDIDYRVKVAADLRSQEVKDAVKEALNDKRLDDLATQLTNLATQVTSGFTAVHTRQDVANGKLLSHQAKFDKMSGTQGYERFIWFVVTALVGVVVFFITKHF